MLFRYLVILILTLPFSVYAETPKPSYVPPAPSAISTEGMLQMVASLLLVLAVIGVIAWLLKRFTLNRTTASGAIKIIATAGVGQRERIVIVEVENTRLVLGVAPGRVNTLHCMDKSPLNSTDKKLSELDKFPEQLKQSIKNYEQ